MNLEKIRILIAAADQKFVGALMQHLVEILEIFDIFPFKVCCYKLVVVLALAQQLFWRCVVLKRGQHS